MSSAIAGPLPLVLVLYLNQVPKNPKTRIVAEANAAIGPTNDALIELLKDLAEVMLEDELLVHDLNDAHFEEVDQVVFKGEIKESDEKGYC